MVDVVISVVDEELAEEVFLVSLLDEDDEAEVVLDPDEVELALELDL